VLLLPPASDQQFRRQIEQREYGIRESSANVARSTIAALMLTSSSLGSIIASGGGSG
jgi:hypothetical protein